MALSKIDVANMVTGTVPTANGGNKIAQTLNVINNTEVASSSSTYATTGLNLNITPSATSSKILIIVTQAGVGKNNSDTKCNLKLQRGTTDIHQFDNDAGYNNGTTSNYVGSSSVCYLDSPNTTSQTNYRTIFASHSDTSNVSVNTNGSDSTMTLMEILA
jgi:hypothetical protein